MSTNQQRDPILQSSFHSPAGSPMAEAEDTSERLIIKLAPETIHISDEPNRCGFDMHDPDFEALVESVSGTGGNDVPVEIHYREGPDGIEPWLTSGFRRVMACRVAKQPVFAFVRVREDDGMAHLHRLVENAHRKELSPLERGRQIEHGFTIGIFRSERQAAALIGVDPSDLNKLRRLGQLNPRMVEAFRSPHDLQFRHAKPLTDAVAANPDAVLAEADRLAGLDPRLPSDQVLTCLVDAGRAAVVGPSHAPSRQHALACDGAVVGRWRSAKSGSVRLELDMPLNAKQQALLAKTIERFVRAHVLAEAKTAKESEVRE